LEGEKPSKSLDNLTMPAHRNSVMNRGAGRRLRSKYLKSSGEISACISQACTCIDGRARPTDMLARHSVAAPDLGELRE